MAFVPEHAPLAILTLLGTGLLLAAAGAGLVLGLVTRRRRLAAWALAVIVAVGASYSGALLALSLTSEERTLAASEWKYFRCSVTGTSQLASPACHPEPVHGEPVQGEPEGQGISSPRTRRDSSRSLSRAEPRGSE